MCTCNFLLHFGFTIRRKIAILHSWLPFKRWNIYQFCNVVVLFLPFVKFVYRYVFIPSNLYVRRKFIEISGIIPLWLFSVIIFVLAWVGQFYGHKIEGKKPSFLKDLQFLMIGPAWLMSFIYKKLDVGL